jgi:predicted RNase H-like HicB family nuclease
MRKQAFHTKEYTYTAVYEPLKEGGYQVMVPLMPGLVTYGRTFEEARKMARDAIRCYLEGLLKERLAIPNETALLQEKVSVRV